MTISDPQGVTIGDQLPRSSVFEQNAKGRTSLEPSQQVSWSIPRLSLSTLTLTHSHSQDWVNVFGPAGMDVKLDKNRFNRYNRVHLPDVLKGPNQFLTDRIDGLITDATNSPFTTLILPYQYIETPDAKIKWNVW